MIRTLYGIKRYDSWFTGYDFSKIENRRLWTTKGAALRALKACLTTTYKDNFTLMLNWSDLHMVAIQSEESEVGSSAIIPKTKKTKFGNTTITTFYDQEEEGEDQ